MALQWMSGDFNISGRNGYTAHTTQRDMLRLISPKLRTGRILGALRAGLYPVANRKAVTYYA